ncbi:hypothetical protein [Agromyces sp. PvR057]|uniref:hypothetical protein n=1 Tax=Agromyces sp. PvR057 TaxID=3156403 RepID=UPI000E39A62E
MAGNERHDADPIRDAAGDRDAEVARLQRVAFGSGATDAEREAAVRELAGVDSSEGSALLAVPRSAAATPPRSTGDVTPGGRAPASVTPDRPESRLRWTLVAGALALAAGVLVGWGLGSRDALDPVSGASPPPSSSPPATAVAYAEYLESLPLVSQAGAAAVFSRESISGDALSRSWVRDGFRQQRLLLTLPDGSGVFAALRDREACLIIDFVPEGGLSRCTENGRFPEGGIRVAAEREAARFEVVWLPDGTVTVTAVAP